jgi:hypothetical protein
VRRWAVGIPDQGRRCAPGLTGAAKRRGPERKATVARKHMLGQVKSADREIPHSEVMEAHHERPRTRAECVAGPRPCPWVGCRFHLWGEVSDAGGLTIFRPEVDPLDMDDTCALDLADRGGMTLEEVADRFNLTRERIRQIEDMALRKLGADFPTYDGGALPKSIRVVRIRNADEIARFKSFKDGGTTWH